MHVFQHIHCHSHTSSSLQVSTAPTPPCKYNMSTYHNTTKLTKHSTYESSYFVNVLQKPYCVPQFETEFKEENLIKEYHTMPIIIQKIIEKPKFNKSLYIDFKN